MRPGCGSPPGTGVRPSGQRIESVMVLNDCTPPGLIWISAGARKPRAMVPRKVAIGLTVHLAPTFGTKLVSSGYLS